MEATHENIKKMIAANPPRAYDLTRPDEVHRLIRECRGYIATCRKQHHGTDFEGRMFAVDALEQLLNEPWKIVVHPPEPDAP